MVVKVGSSSLTQPSGHLDVKKLNSLVAALSAASAQGARVVLVRRAPSPRVSAARLREPSE